MFFDFFSAFNTIQPALLRDKLENTGVDHHLTYRIFDYLTERPQYVRLCVRCSCLQYRSPAGNSPGSVPLHPLYCILFPTTRPLVTCRSSPMTLQSSASSLMRTTRSTGNLRRTLWTGASRTASRSTRGKLKNWLWISADNHSAPPTPVNIQGPDIEMLTSYKHLGVHLNNKLDWTHNTTALYKKGQSRLSAQETEVFWSAGGTPEDLL